MITSHAKLRDIVNLIWQKISQGSWRDPKHIIFQNLIFVRVGRSNKLNWVEAQWAMGCLPSNPCYSLKCLCMYLGYCTVTYASDYDGNSRGKLSKEWNKAKALIFFKSLQNDCMMIVWKERSTTFPKDVTHVTCDKSSCSVIILAALLPPPPPTHLFPTPFPISVSPADRFTIQSAALVIHVIQSELIMCDFLYTITIKMMTK